MPQLDKKVLNAYAPYIKIYIWLCMLKYILLGFISYKPLTGYELEAYINVSAGNFWHATLSQIYMTLKKLEEDALMQSTIEPQIGKPDRRVYTITDAGRADLQAWLRQPIDDSIIKKDALMVKVFFSPPDQVESLVHQLRIHLDLHRRQLQVYQQDAAQAMIDLIQEYPALLPNSRYWELTRRYGELYEQTYIQWLQETIEQLEAR